MANETIEVEWIGTAKRMEQVLERMDARFDKQEAALKKLADTSTKTANAAAGSFNKLEQELKEGEKALKNMTIGTQEFAAQKRKVDAMRASLEGAKGQIQGTGSEMQSMASMAITKLAGMAAGLGAVRMVVSAIMDELKLVEAQKLKASQTMQSVEASMAKLGQNIGGEQLAKARSMIEEQSPKLGVSQEGLAGLIASAISGGAADLQEALKLSELTLKLTAGNAQEAAPIMSGMLTMAETTGNRDFASVLGQMQQFQEAARGEDLSVSIRNMASAMAAANTRGERIAALGSERTLEISSVLSQLLQDPQMATTGTTMRQMFNKMDSFIAKQETTLDDGTKSRLSPEVAAAFNKLSTFDERVAAMRSNNEIAKQFLSTIEENQGKFGIRQLVRGDANAIKWEQNSARIVTGSEQAVEAFDKLTAAINEQTRNLQAANRSKAVEQLTDPVTAMEGTIAETFNRAVDNITDASGLDSWTKDDARRAFQIRQKIGGQTAADAAITTLEELKQQETAFGFIPAGGQISESDQRKLDLQIAELKGLREDLQALVRAQETANQQARRPSPQPVRPRVAPLPAETAP